MQSFSTDLSVSLNCRLVYAQALVDQLKARFSNMLNPRESSRKIFCTHFFCCVDQNWMLLFDLVDGLIFSNHQSITALSVSKLWILGGIFFIAVLRAKNEK